MQKFVKQQSGTLLGFFNFFSGGALEQLSIFALGIMPYISSSIILQLLTVRSCRPSSGCRKKANPVAIKITQYTRYGAVVLSIAQGFAIATYLESLHPNGEPVVTDPGWMFRFLTVVSSHLGHGVHHVAQASKSPSAASATAFR